MWIRLEARYSEHCNYPAGYPSDELSDYWFLEKCAGWLIFLMINCVITRKKIFEHSINIDSRLHTVPFQYDNLILEVTEPRKDELECEIPTCFSTVAPNRYKRILPAVLFHSPEK